jgi:hypothetical protein
MKNDKLQHFLAGFGLTVAILLGVETLGTTNILLIFLVVYLWAVTKEVLDKLSGKGECDPYDFIWTVNGLMVLIIIIYGYMWYSGSTLVLKSLILRIWGQ